MAFSAEIRARLGLDTTTFNTQLQAVPGALERMGNKAQGIIARTFSFSNIAKGFLSGLGIGSALAVINKISGAISESIEHAGKLSLIFDEIAGNARAASEAISRVGKSEGEIIEQLGNKIDGLKKKRDDLLNSSGSKSFFGGLIEKGSALDKLFGFSRDEEITRAEKLKKLNQEIGQTVVETAQKKDAVVKKSNEEELRQIREMLNEENKRAEAVQRLAEFERAQRRDKMQDAELINDLELERRTVAQQVANYEKAQREGIVLTAQGVGELLDLKEQQAALEEKIARLTIEKSKSEQVATEAVLKQLEAKQALDDLESKKNLVQRDTLFVNGKAYGQARDPALFERASTQELEELIRRLREEVGIVEQNKGTGSTALADAATGFLIQGSVIARLLTDIQRAEFQLTERQKLARDKSLYGEAGALRNFKGDPLEFDESFARTRGLTDNERFISELEKLRREQERSLQSIAETLKSLR